MFANVVQRFQPQNNNDGKIDRMLVLSILNGLRFRFVFRRKTNIKANGAQNCFQDKRLHVFQTFVTVEN